ncbi:MULTISPECIES: carboxypeptidase-like regulatory domain-containing protein [unclassified Meiothermus]|uniref:carboxypeptidase-like regulatory domain-containing protein n=1 Tax=unclassified Meiothermus TaxID=370471 RepID=UPI00102110D7|nr:MULTISPECIES: carboxypeptidase-like regulatory domain-containing protein [unclassified Meiothermus]RYM37317.1 carboxypeptidase regulatory-like domain-containing protein [Meiothermus sp. PNK-Is4]
MQALLALGILLTLGACGGGGGGGFSGTVTAPAGATVQGTVVLACFYLAATDSCDQDKSKTTSINTSGRSGNFSIEGLAAGDYVIVAQNEAQGLIGIYLDSQGNPAIVKPPRSGINIQLVQP